MLPRFKHKLILFSIALLAFLPLAGLQLLATWLGKLFYLLPNRAKTVARINIATFFPDYSDGQKTQLLKDTLIENARVLTEMVKFTQLSAEKTDRLISKIHNAELFERCLAAQKGLIVIGPHLGNWELGLHAVTRFGPVTAMYSPPKQDYLDQLIHQTRERAGAKLVPANTAGIRHLLKALRNGEIIGILPDQKPKAGQASIAAPFLGMDVETMLLIQTLAERTGAPMLFSYSKRFSKGFGVVRFEHFFVEAPIGLDSTDNKQAATALNQGVERCVLNNIAQYQWTYKRLPSRFYDRNHDENH